MFRTYRYWLLPCAALLFPVIAEAGKMVPTNADPLVQTDRDANDLRVQVAGVTGPTHTAAASGQRPAGTNATAPLSVPLALALAAPALGILYPLYRRKRPQAQG
jgi:hypothetical protein